MGVTYSVQSTVFRATNFDRNLFRSLATSSFGATDEFCTSVDLSDTNPPTLPLTISTPGINTISFLVMSITGGMVNIGLQGVGGGYSGFSGYSGDSGYSGGYSGYSGYVESHLDVNAQGLIIMSGANLTGLTINAIVSGSPFVEIFGMGS